MTNSIYITSHGELKRENNTLCHVTKNSKSFLPFENTRDIYIFGEVSMTRSSLAMCGRNGISVHMFGYYGDYLGSFNPSSIKNSGATLVKQVQLYLDQHQRLTLAKLFIKGSMLNMISVVKYYHRRNKPLDSAISKLYLELGHIDSAKNINSLMSIEGRARNYYYHSFNSIIEGNGFEFVQRTRRPPRDPLNALMSYLNCLCYSTVLSCIYHSHLDPSISYLHESNHRSHSLNLDLADVFKPILVDRLLFTFINKRIIKISNFKKEKNGIHLDKKSAGVVLKHWNEKLTSLVPREIAGKGNQISYQELIKREVIKLQKHILQEQPYEPLVMRW